MAQIDHDNERDTPPPDLLPEREMEIEMVESEQKEGKNNLSIVWQVASGDYAGRKLFETLNLWYVNEHDADKQKRTREMARRRLTEICEACGKSGAKDSHELHGITIRGKIKTRKGENGFEDRSEVGKVFPLSGGKPGTSSPSTALKASWRNK